MKNANPDLRSIATTISTLLGIRSPHDAETLPLAMVTQSLGIVSRLAVVVIDAFGISTWKAHRRYSQTFNALAERSLLTLRSVNLPKTPVAFSSMTTGVSPEVHGVHVRTDPLAQETIFEVLREAGRTSGVAARVTSSPNYLLASRADYRGIAESGLDADVLSYAMHMVEQQTPDYLLVHFLDVDNISHAHGPSSAECGEAVAVTDGRLRTLIRALAERKYALLVLADHGQHLNDKPDAVKPGQHDGTSENDFLVPLTWADSATLLEMVRT